MLGFRSFLINCNLEACYFIKKETSVHVFSFEYCKTFKNTFGRYCSAATAGAAAEVRQKAVSAILFTLCSIVT